MTGQIPLYFFPCEDFRGEIPRFYKRRGNDKNKGSDTPEVCLMQRGCGADHADLTRLCEAKALLPRIRRAGLEGGS